MSTIKPKQKFEFPTNENIPLSKKELEVFLENTSNQRITNKNTEEIHKKDQEKIADVRTSLSKIKNDNDCKIDYADQMMLPIMEYVEREMAIFDSVLYDIAASTPGTWAWENAETEKMYKDFLADTLPTIKNKIKQEVSAGTLSDDEVKELVEILSLDDNFKFWYKTLWSMKKTEKKYDEMMQCSALDILRKNRTLKRKLLIGIKNLF